MSDFTDDDVDAVLAIIDTDPIGPPTPGCDNCDLMQQECIRCEVRRALSAVAPSIAARALRKARTAANTEWLDFIGTERQDLTATALLSALSWLDTRADHLEGK